MARRARGDGASTHVLEAVTVATVMLASVAYVVTLDVPPAATGGQREILQQKALDALAILNDTPIDSKLGDNLLSVAIHECLQQDCSRLRDKLDGLLPIGAKYGVYLSTRDGLVPVYAPRSPAGEAVTARRSIEPAWSYQFLAPSQSLYNPLEDPLVVYGLPVFSGSPLQQGSSALRITVEGKRADNAAYVMHSSATTRAVDSDTTPTPSAVSIFFHDGLGVPIASRDVRASTLDGAGSPSYAATPFFVRIVESGGGIVPAGTMLTIQLPHGWTGSAQTAANAADWTWVANATDRNGTSSASSIIVKTRHDITSDHVDFVFDATYFGDADDYYDLAASLSAGAYARSRVLVRADGHASTPPFEVPAIVLSVPRPLGVSATTTWTLAAFSSDPVTVDRIEIAEEEARAIFGSIAPLTGSGSWTSSGDKLVWTGSAILSHHSPLNLTFQVTSSGLGGPAGDRAPYVPSVGISDYSGRLLQESSPGLYRGIFLPSDESYQGYNSSTGPGLRTTHEVDSTSAYRATALPGSMDYGVGYVVGLKDSIFGSAVTARERRVSPGDPETLQIDAQSVMYELGTLGFTPSIDLYVYPPWAGDDRDPIESFSVYDGTLAAGSDPFLALLDQNGDLLPDATSVGRHNVTFDVPRTWLYGPFVVEARISWLEALDHVVDGVPLTEQVVRTASVFDYFIVEPPGGELPASAIYDVHLVAWFEDWY